MNNPRITLSLEHMRMSMVHAFANYAEDFEKNATEALDRAIKNFDYDKEIRLIADSEISRLANELVRDAVRSLRWDRAVSEALTETIVKKLKEPTQ